MLPSELDVDRAVYLTFSGDDLTNSVEFWMQKFKEYAKGKGLTPEATLRAAKLKLMGSARTWLSYQDNINTWECFQESILAEFKTNTPRIQEMMGSKKKEPSQSIMNYIHEMRLFGYQAQMDDGDIMESIIKGSTEDKYLRAILRTATSFQMLRKVLEGFEEESKSHDPVTHGVKSAKASPYSFPRDAKLQWGWGLGTIAAPLTSTAAALVTSTAAAPVVSTAAVPAASIVTPMPSVYTFTNANPPFFGYRYY